jgi:hypothetical protein
MVNISIVLLIAPQSGKLLPVFVLASFPVKSKQVLGQGLWNEYPWNCYSKPVNSSGW